VTISVINEVEPTVGGPPTMQHGEADSSAAMVITFNKKTHLRCEAGSHHFARSLCPKGRNKKNRTRKSYFTADDVYLHYHKVGPRLKATRCTEPASGEILNSPQRIRVEGLAHVTTAGCDTSHRSYSLTPSFGHSYSETLHNNLLPTRTTAN
jgi:hypothetical protein